MLSGLTAAFLLAGTGFVAAPGADAGTARVPAPGADADLNADTGFVAAPDAGTARVTAPGANAALNADTGYDAGTGFVAAPGADAGAARVTAPYAHAAPHASAPRAEAQPDKLRIVGGVASKEGAWPSVVALEFPDSQLCAGTVVADNLIVTAAHCFSSPHPQDSIQIHIGNSVRTSTVMLSASWGVHPQYANDAHGQDKSYDYAYVTIDGSFNLGDYPRPLTSQTEYDLMMRSGQSITLVGYGQDDQGLLGVKREVVTQIRTFTPQGRQFLTTGQGKDSCRGDSGGPAFSFAADGSLVWMGVLSAGSKNCGEGGYYGVPLPMLTWLQQQTGYNPGGCLNENCLNLVPPSAPSDPGKRKGGCRLAAASPSALPWLCGGVSLGLFSLGRSTRRRRKGSRLAG